jgi:hypothetical protein
MEKVKEKGKLQERQTEKWDLDSEYKELETGEVA